MGSKPKNKKTRTRAKTKKPGSFVQGNPKFAVLALGVVYFLLDYLMVDVTENIHPVLTALFTLLAPSVLYIHYVMDYQKGAGPAGGADMPKFIKDKKRYAITGWLVITLWGIAFLAVEPLLVSRFFPVVDKAYYRSQVMSILFIAPVMEEIIFRYLLYDRVLRPKWGRFWGFLAASLIFVAFHPVANMHAFVIYWVPTVLFFLVYQEFGLYGSIVVHMVYNTMAI